MNKKFLIIMACLLFLAASDTIKTSDQCACDKITSENDCKAKSTCAWTAGTPATDTTPATQGKCATPTTPTTPTVETFCGSVTDAATNCWKTYGCAYVDSKCTHFTGCTAYVKTTNSDCQAISQYCITDGTQCVNAKQCTEYTTQAECSNPSISGIKKCKYENGACRDYICSEADASLTTNTACDAWLAGCITKGKGCSSSPLGACSSYTGDDTACAGLIGQDGKCEGTSGGTQCKARVCTGADATLDTDEKCADYQTGCLTTGKGCIASPLPACSTYLGDNTTCVGYKGSDGICEGDQGAANCRARKCENAPSSTKTNADCNAYRAGCVTTGKGCIATLGGCGSYQGTASTCEGYIGSDGNCKGNGTTQQPCLPRTCADAQATLNTDALCSSFFAGCVTTGKGCTASRQSCTLYQGTTTTCEGYIGTEGKCKGVSTTDPTAACAKKLCSDAASTLTTNEACAAFQNGCVTNGAGCVEETTCLNTIKQISCTGSKEGSTNCGWNSICVSNTSCAGFQTASICEGNLANGTTPCIWENSSCRNKKCSDAPNTYNSDTQCSGYLTDCITNGGGCLAKSDSCSFFKGTQNQCKDYSTTIKCWNEATATATTVCIVRQCSHGDSTFTTDGQCSSFLSGCVTNGAGCIASTEPCGKYNGTIDICQKFTGNGKKCWGSSATASGPCIDRVCSQKTDANQISDCEAFLTGCLFDGKTGCLDNTATCDKYTGTKDTCTTFKGSSGNKPCYSSSSTPAACSDKQCGYADAATHKTNEACETFLTGCVAKDLTNGGCIENSANCGSYSGTIDQCEKFVGNKINACTNRVACTDRTCGDVLNPTKQEDCTNYLSNCQYFNSQCVTSTSCSNYTSNNDLSLTLCQDVLDNSSPSLKCWWTSGKTCEARTCANASNPKLQADCDAHLNGKCMFDGSKCVDINSCGNYAPTVTDKLAACNAMKDSNSKTCFWVSGSNCVDRKCDNVPVTPTPITGQTQCSAHMSGCLYMDTKCFAAASCDNYTFTTTTLSNSDKLTACKGIKDNNGVQCFWTTASNTKCTALSCTNADNPTSQTSCDNHYPDKCYFSFACGDRTCAGNSTATKQTDCDDWKANCQWLGTTTCADKPADCSKISLTGLTDPVKKTVCEGVLTSATTPGDHCLLKQDGSACIASVSSCSSLTGLSANAQSYCQQYKLGTKTCDAGTTDTACKDMATCADAIIPNTKTTDADKKDFCGTLVTTAGQCTLKNDKTGCVATTTYANCAAITGLTAGSSTISFCQLYTLNNKNCNASSTDTACKDMASCSDATIPSTANTDTLKANFCSGLKVTQGTCKLTEDKSSCIVATIESCSSLVGLQGGATAVKTYCQALKSGVITCDGDTDKCKDMANCADATLQGSTDQEKAQFCQKIQTTEGQCVLNADKNACTKAIKCSSISGLTAGTANVTLCEQLIVAGKSCSATSTDTACKDLAACTDATLTGTSDAEKIAFCQSLKTTAGSCTLKVDKTGCVAATACSSISGLTAGTATVTLCELLIAGGKSCSATNTDTACKDLAACTDATLQGTSDAQKIAFCQSLKPTTGGSCTLKGDKTGCVAATACSSISGLSAGAATVTLCELLIAGGKSCSATNTDTACKDLAACTDATLQGTSDAQKIAFCQSLKPTTGGSCTLKGDKTGCVAATACSSISGLSAGAATVTLCEQLIAGGKSCSATSTDTACKDLAACTDATLQGTSDAQKIAFCQSLKPTTGGSCTLNGSKSKCIGAICSAQTGLTAGPATQQYCNLLTLNKISCTAASADTACKDSAACTDAVIPTSFANDIQKAQFCANYTSATACLVNSALNGCIATQTSCSGITGLTAGSTIPAYCQLLTLGGKTCTAAATDTACKDMTACTDVIFPSSISLDSEKKTHCETTIKISGVNCIVNAAKNGCAAKPTSCSAGDVTGITDDAVKTSFCEGLSSISCQYSSGNSCEDRTCSKKTNATSNKDCTDWKSTCRYVGLGTCVDAKTNCSDYVISNSLTTQSSICDGVTNGAVAPLGCQKGSLSCQDRTCATRLSPGSNDDCKKWKETCVFNGQICVDKAACNTYTVSGTDSDKKKYCDALVNGSDIACTWLSGTACTDRNCSTDTNVNADSTKCVSSYLSACRWDASISGSVKCLTATACTSYVANGGNDTEKQTNCMKLTDNNSKSCGFTSGTNCADRNCGNAPTPTSNDSCKQYLADCRISNDTTAICIIKTSSCEAYKGTPTQCQNYLGANDTKPCWSTTSGTTIGACVTRTCSLNTTATSDTECNLFLKDCKFNGTAGCTDPSTACSLYKGNSQTCSAFIAGDGKNKCKVNGTGSGSCLTKTCFDDVTSTTNDQCKTFMSGCVTNGKGCVPDTQVCSKYYGKQDACKNFVGNKTTKCWNTTTALDTTPCVDRKCSDDTTSTTDAACEAFMTGCVTKGTGCIESTQQCSAYSGKKDVCEKFKGNKTTPCYNLDTATDTTSCINKLCTHNTIATTDEDCKTFLSGCVTKGKGCVTPQPCSQFTGTTEECGKFTATNGKCKSTVLVGSGACKLRICTEAPNTLKTDADCLAYQTGCVTTGYGCVSSVSCATISDSSACKAKGGCAWVNNCRQIGSTCSSLTTYGQSICINTPVTTTLKYCAWSGTTCRDPTCDDLSDSLTSHDACSKIISNCTTKGTGCITKTACSSYTTETICKAAQTTDPGTTCIWDSTVCRAKKCSDATTGTTTNDGCNTFLAGCKTDGTKCINSGFTCSSLVSAAACLSDSSSKPCLYVGASCYNYAKCEDISNTTHTSCQAFSPQCTTDASKCIAITSCAKTVQQISCVIGTDGTCGWLPANGANAAKCQKYGACSDAVSSDNAACKLYGSNCITDGIKCIDFGTCSSYTTQVACEYGGTDGKCQFSSNACRLRECTDATATNATSITTHSGCYAFQAKTKCTTNGTSCIPLGTCSSYTLEEGCQEGTDGICIFALPVGTTTTTTKSCRLKVCQDFTLTQSAACSIALTGAGKGNGCVSNGTNCIVKATCSTYTTKEACNGGGTDGVCAFTPGSTTTPTVGTCKLMSACSDANNDQTACNSKSAQCQWKSTGSGTTTSTSCQNQDCTSKANGSVCNPVPSFDLTTYNVCIPAATGTGCVLGDGTALTSTTCYGYTLGTYTWNVATSKCEACFTVNTTNPPSENPGTGSTYGYILQATILTILAIVIA